MTCAQAYSYAQLEQLWINAGGPKAVAPVAAAIAMAESAGCVNAAYPGTTVPVGQGSWSDATGLWQILGAPSGNWSASDLTSPTGNAAMAVQKYKDAGGSFSPWATYSSGAYKAYLSNSTTPDPNVPAGSAASGGGSAVTLTSSGARCLVGGNTFIPCLLTASNARGIIGGLCMLTGATFALAGLVLLAAVGIGRSPAGPLVPGPAGKVIRKVS